MKRLCLIVALLLPVMAAGSVKYILGGGGASGTTGVDWAHACADFTGSCALSAFAASDVACVGNSSSGVGGFYANSTSFSKSITVLGATATDAACHLGAGWNASFGTDVSPAKFYNLTFTAVGVVFDCSGTLSASPLLVTSAMTFGCWVDNSQVGHYTFAPINVTAGSPTIRGVKGIGTGHGGNTGEMFRLATIANSGAVCNNDGTATFKVNVGNLSGVGQGQFQGTRSGGFAWANGQRVLVTMGSGSPSGSGGSSFNGTGTVQSQAWPNIIISSGCTPGTVSGSDNSACSFSTSFGAGGIPTSGNSGNADPVNCAVISGVNAGSESFVHIVPNPTSGVISNVLFERNWILGANSEPFVIRSVNGYTIQYNLIQIVGSNPAQHGNTLTDDGSFNGTYRWNTAEDGEGTGLITVLASTPYNQAITSVACSGGTGTLVTTANSGNPLSVFPNGSNLYMIDTVGASFDTGTSPVGPIVSGAGTNPITYTYSNCGANRSVAAGGIVGVKVQDSLWVYGNSWANTNGNTNNMLPLGNGVLSCINGEICTNLKAFNNTYSNLGNVLASYGTQSNVIAFDFQNGAHGSMDARNNLFWNSGAAVTFTAGSATLTESFNSNYNGIGSLSGSNDKNYPAAASPFSSWTTGNFSLSSNTDAGSDTSAIIVANSTDAAGATRTTYSRGFLEFGGAPPFTLTAACGVGLGTGTIATTQVGHTLSCVCTAGVSSGTCTENHAAADNITVTATTGDSFAGFTGACSTTPCTISNVQSNLSVTGTFVKGPTITLTSDTGYCNPINGCSPTLTATAANCNTPGCVWECQDFSGSLITDTVTGLPAFCAYGSTVNALCGDGTHPSGAFSIHWKISDFSFNPYQTAQCVVFIPPNVGAQSAVSTVGFGAYIAPGKSWLQF